MYYTDTPSLQPLLLDICIRRDFLEIIAAYFTARAVPLAILLFPIDLMKSFP